MNLFRSALLAAALSLPGAAFASISLSCAASVCSASVSAPGSPTPFKYSWNWAYAPGAPHVGITWPYLCDGTLNCFFNCSSPTTLLVTFTARDANDALIGSATESLYCSLE